MSAEVVLVPVFLELVMTAASFVASSVIAKTIEEAIESLPQGSREKAWIGEERITNLKLERERLDRERRRLRSDEVLKKARELKTIEEFNEWYASEVAKVKALEAHVLKEIERVKLELFEKRRELEGKLERARMVLSKFGVNDLDGRVSSTSELESELGRLTDIASRELERARVELSLRLAELPPVFRAQAESMIEGFWSGVDDPISKLELYTFIRNELLNLEAYARAIRESSEKVDLSKYRFNVEEVKKSMERSTMLAQSSKLKEEIRLYLELVGNLDERVARGLRERLRNFENSTDLFHLRNMLDEVKISYGTLKTEIMVSNAYRKLIEEMRRTYRDYQSVQRLASEVLALEKIRDQDYKRFIEEMSKFLVRDKTNELVKTQRKRIAEILQKSLEARGYELLVEEDGEAADALEAGRVVEISPNYTSEHFIKVRMREDGQLVFKFFKSDDSHGSFENDLRFSKRWCEDLKEIVGQLNVDVPTQTLYILEPEETREFSKASSSARRRKSAKQEKGQVQRKNMLNEQRNY